MRAPINVNVAFLMYMAQTSVVLAKPSKGKAKMGIKAVIDNGIQSVIQ